MKRTGGVEGPFPGCDEPGYSVAQVIQVKTAPDVLRKAINDMLQLTRTGSWGALILSSHLLALSIPQKAVDRAGPQQPLPGCASGLVDQSGGPCLQASSEPTPGLLFPPPHDGGVGNVVSTPHGFIGGGVDNTAGGGRAAICGGRSNVADGNHAAVVGGFDNEATGTHAFIGGGLGNVASGARAVVAGGRNNLCSAGDAVIAGGFGHTVSADNGTVSGGKNNFVIEPHGTVSGGIANATHGYAAAVGGGFDNRAAGEASTVAGGGLCLARGTYSTVGGGYFNWIGYGARSATIVGGERNTIGETGSFALAAGRRAHADHAGAFVWGDSQDVDKPSSLDDQFNVYASGGTRIFSDASATNGVSLAPGAGSWSSVSDRDAKENIDRIDVREVLERLVAVPISSWNYKAQDESVRHVGPMAQDFYAAFGLGLGKRCIDTVDADGVALAAIQGLNEKLVEKEREIEELRARLDELEGLGAQLDALRAEVARIER